MFCHDLQNSFILKAFIYFQFIWKKWVREKSHVLIHFASDHNSQIWTCLKWEPGAPSISSLLAT